SKGAARRACVYLHPCRSGHVGPRCHRRSTRDARGLWFGVAGFAIYGLARTGAVFWMAAPVSGLWGLSGPPMQGLMTRHVNAFEQGQLQGALSSLRGIAFMIG